MKENFYNVQFIAMMPMEMSGLVALSEDLEEAKTAFEEYIVNTYGEKAKVTSFEPFEGEITDEQREKILERSAEIFDDDTVNTTNTLQ